jgi:hypothetical protein
MKTGSAAGSGDVLEDGDAFIESSIQKFVVELSSTATPGCAVL